MDSRTTDPVTDSVLEHEIEKALAVKPSSEFLARVRVRIAGEPTPVVWGFTWKLASAGALSIAMVILAVAVSWQEREATRDVSNVSRAASTETIEPTRDAEGRTEPSRPARFASTTRPSLARRAEPPPSEVLISHDEAAALRQLFEDISTRRIEPSLLLDITPASMPLAPIGEIAIEPIVVGPLAPIGSE